MSLSPQLRRGESRQKRASPGASDSGRTGGPCRSVDEVYNTARLGAILFWPSPMPLMGLRTPAAHLFEFSITTRQWSHLPQVRITLADAATLRLYAGSG